MAEPQDKTRVWNMSRILPSLPRCAYLLDFSVFAEWLPQLIWSTWKNKKWPHAVPTLICYWSDSQKDLGSAMDTISVLGVEPHRRNRGGSQRLEDFGQAAQGLQAGVRCVLKGKALDSLKHSLLGAWCLNHTMPVRIPSQQIWGLLCCKKLVSTVFYNYIPTPTPRWEKCILFT